jgi:hypothetical protein
MLSLPRTVEDARFPFQAVIPPQVFVHHAAGGEAFAGALVGGQGVRTADLRLVMQPLNGAGQAGGIVGGNTGRLSPQSSRNEESSTFS